MAEACKSLSKAAADKYIMKTHPGTYQFFVEPDLAKMTCLEDETGLVPITDSYMGNNVAVWVRAHGSDAGDLWMGGPTTPADIKEAVVEYWGSSMPIILTCCHPAKVFERYGKELAANGIHLMERRYEGTMWSTPPNISAIIAVHTNTVEMAIRSNTPKFARRPKGA